MAIRKLVHKYVVKSFECDRKDTLRLLTLLNLFQDLADDSANEIGIGYDYLRTVGKAWVLIAMNVEIDRMPHLQEEITIKSWPSDTSALYTEREFEVWSASGERIIRACSQWIVIDFASRRPVHLNEWLPLYEPIREKVITEGRFPKLLAVERDDYSERFLVRYDDIDRNNHVNNAIYSLWASESLVPEYRLEHEPARLDINFKKEGLFGEKILVHTQMDANTSLHSIQSAEDGRELARVKFLWR
jgi:medium-chain acyl-[acyl-carrier-protein] hydrolase